MRMDRFSTELQYNRIRLIFVSDIVITSFISQKSISHLDLQLSERILQKEWLYSAISPSSSVKKSFFCSEESLRNYFVPKRRLLYTLHLDLPDGREYSSLRYGPAPNSFSYNPTSLFVAFKCGNFPYSMCWTMLVEAAFDRTDCKLKLLKWIIDFRALKSIFLSRYNQIFYAKLLYQDCVDSEFAMKCFEKVIRINQFKTTEHLKFLEHLLYQARVCDFDVRRKKSSGTSLTDYCIETISFLTVQSILKYEDRAYYTEESYDFYKQQLFQSVGIWDNWDEIIKPGNLMSKLRHYRMLQIIFIFDNGPRFYEVHASEALRLVWSSIPDYFVCLQEMTDAYGNVLSAKAISERYNFYKEAIRQTDICREPRSLSQYCRSIIRKILADKKLWLPDGIKQLKLPPRLEPFLNLQRDNLHPENFEAPKQTED